MNRFNILKLSLLPALIATAGCASPPGSVPAASVSDERYLPMDCVTLREERERVLSTLQAASSDQTSRATRDAVASAAGVAVSPLFFVLLTGETVSAAEVSRLKGEYYAIERSLAGKRCDTAVTAPR